MRAVLSAALLFALTALTLILLRPLMPVDETRYLAAAWEMRIGGSPWVPHLNGALYGHKPPLLFWLINLVWALGSVAAFPARLVAPAFAVASVVLTGLLARRLWPDQPARAGAAALILAVSPVWLVFGSTTMFDAMLTCATLLAMLALWSAARRPRRSAFVALGAAVAFGVYAKGPVILLHVLPAALAMPLWAGPGRPSGRAWAKGLALALLAALLLVGLWLVPALMGGGAEYRTEVLWRQSGGRMVASFAHRKPWWFFLALLPPMAWPFGWTVPGLAALHPRRLWADPGARLAALWAAGAFVAFSLISGKQAHYLLPEMPALALLLAGGLPARRWRRRDLWLALPLVAALAGFGAAAAGLIPALVRLGDPLPVWSLALGAACLLAGIAGFGRLRSAPVALAALPLALVIGLHLALGPLLFARHDMTALGRAVAPFDARGIAVTDGSYHAQLNFAGRLRNPVARLAGPQAVETWRQAHPGGLLLDQTGLPVPGMRAVAALPYRGGTYTLHRSQEVAP
ncbi:phospholipid carrier-dependent glycosyltransferase [Paracoccus sp. YIM 132242]|uniref:Phospholipid carrier-dependent glycosyltransferase n=1 Tax=Paracoccus lichenicola TaxID=2665644 RepID=A0A6L6HUY6_9RHOB|nr:glycosyltransferase family 39 protein [Paracoccus lichenicola]MTE01098.1 phospholipid carrier-dependent glycosyltransferase [Paracoccus lichenicola]